ncbi:lipase 1-like isoform X2 [Galleria mellonella]|uniref:Lipase 1-like isoform X2 n=1 Tax=Galleria mellonella TaxID=7137 RepID=A0A6J3BV97_GALME|nr:lipase 1-like isoform X2 [Galleria mellonella]
MHFLMLIPHGRDQNNESDPTRPVVLAMHGLISSSADFITQGPNVSLGYILAESGYDVWLANARGNYYSRANLYLDPDDRRNQDFWRFSWDEIGNIDIPTIVDYILELTGHSKLHYIGHSQGCTSFFVLNSLRPEYNEKFISFQGLAPAAFFVYNEVPFNKVISPYEAVTQLASEKLGFSEILGNRAAFTWFATRYCKEGDIFHDLCVYLLMDGDIDYFNTTLSPVFLGHMPAGSSIRQVNHYAQCVNIKEFRRYDHHRPILNIETYDRPVAPLYNLSQVTAPVYLHYSFGDVTTDYRDVLHLAERLPNVAGMHLIQRSTFSHRDYLWATDAKVQVYNKLIQLMREAEANAK